MEHFYQKIIYLFFKLNKFIFYIVMNLGISFK